MHQHLCSLKVISQDLLCPSINLVWKLGVVGPGLKAEGHGS